ncbi:MAG: sugar ABC transporter ATP-binding protein, partial [Treponema sp.]|nr:sugar ABC transporter ATP-binding protein [Treponema sp.]
MDKNILTVNNLSKYYGVVKALDNVSFSIKKGEVHAICGENGAGKSTFIKLLTGASIPSSGYIEFNGVTYERLTPRQAINIGINGVYQEFSSVPYLTVTENIFLGREIKKFGFNDVKKMTEIANTLCNEIGINLDVTKRVCDLGLAYQQIVEILKAVSQKPQFIIMDEPTAPLTINETDILFNIIIKKLKANGTTILFISHRLEEIFQICDRVTVFCDGKYIITKNTSELTKKDLIAYMVGRELRDDYPHPSIKPSSDILTVTNLCSKKLKNVTFKLKKGEILGFGGLIGAGRTELARAIIGADKIQKGEIKLKGKKYLPKTPRKAILNGIGLIPEKVVLAKVMATDCDILIFDEPTRGIDVEAKQEIYELMCEIVN